MIRTRGRRAPFAKVEFYRRRSLPAERMRSEAVNDVRQLRRGQSPMKPLRTLDRRMRG